jgi:heme-degrading monooxygenase HmoA
MSDRKGGAVLFSEMTPPDGAEDHFNDWYSNHHMPSHVYGVPGFQSGQRYKDADKPDYLAIYDLEAPSTLTDEEYVNRKYTPDAPTKKMLSEVIAFTRYIGDEISFHLRDGIDVDEALDAPVVLAVFIELPDDAAAEFVDWYQTEHAQIVLKSPLWRMIRCMKIVDADPNPFTHMFLHYIESEAALESEELAAARATEWRNRLAQNDWFKTHAVHYRRYGKRYHKAEPEAATFELDI